MNICISTVGEEIKPILYGIRKISKIDKIFLVCSNETEIYARKILRYVNKIYDVKIIKVNATNISDTIRRILLEIEKERNVNEISMNITGGTKIMAISLFILSSIIKSKAFYIFKDCDNKMKYINLPNLKIDLVKLTSRRIEILEKISENVTSLTELSKLMNVSKPTMFSFLNNFKENNLIYTDSKKRIHLTEYGKLILTINKVKNCG